MACREEGRCFLLLWWWCHARHFGIKRRFAARDIMICPLFGTCIYFFSLKTNVFLPLACGKDTRALEKVIVFSIFLTLWRFLSAFCCYWTEIRLGLFSRHSCIFMCFIIRLPGKRNRRQSGKKRSFCPPCCVVGLHIWHQKRFVLPPPPCIRHP